MTHERPFEKLDSDELTMLQHDILDDMENILTRGDLSREQQRLDELKGNLNDLKKERSRR